MKQSKVKAETLGLEENDIVMDQPVYAKAFEILQMPKHQDLKDFIVLRMGAFHTTCTFLSVIGERFSDAGLWDIIVEVNSLGKLLGIDLNNFSFWIFVIGNPSVSFLIAGPGSVEKALNGKHYNNSLRVLKYIFDALNLFKLASFKAWLEEHYKEAAIQEFTSMSAFSDVLKKTTKNSFENLLKMSVRFRELFLTFEEHLYDVSKAGPMASFWQSFMEMMNILFAFFWSVRTVDWSLHLLAT